MGFPDKLLAPDERRVLVLRPHVKVLIAPVVVLLVTVPVAALLARLVPDGDAQRWLRLAVVVVATLVVLRWVVWPFLIWWNTVYAITDRRLVVRTGVLSRSGHDMPLTRLNDVSFSHNVVERALGCGTLVVESAGERGQLELRNVPKVEHVQRTLYRLSDDARGASGRAAPPDADLVDDDRSQDTVRLDDGLRDDHDRR
jgi:uncharacterized membrane protein YdbT with pleckstrin-like domain